MKAFLGFALALAGSLHGQSYGLTPGYDGGSLLFATSWTLRGSGLENANRIYRLTADGTKLFAQASPDAPPRSDVGGVSSSGDGTVIAYGQYTYVMVPSLARIPIPCCTKVIATTLVLGPGDLKREFDGDGRLSANGRFLVLQKDGAVTMADLSSGTSESLPAGLVARTVSDGGVVAGALDGSVVLWTSSQQRVFSAPELDAGTVRISANGSRIVYETKHDYTRTLWALDTSSGFRKALATGDDHTYLASISDDGSAVVYLVGGNRKQAWVIRTDGTGERQLTNLGEEDIAEAVISGSGRTAYVSTRWNRLLKFDLVTQEMQEVFEPLPSIPSAGEPRVPGSAATIREITGVSPSQLAGLVVLVNGKPAPLLKASTTEIIYQLPWEIDPAQQASIEIVVPPPHSPFEKSASYRVPVLYFWPLLQDPVIADNLYLAARHGDGTLVTPDRPAVAGEALALYMSGLGVVTPGVKTGVAADPEPLSPTLNPIGCSVGGTSGVAQPAEVTFAGLAPYQIGVYQVNFRLPASFDTPFMKDGHGYLRFDCIAAALVRPDQYKAIFVQ